MIANDAVRQKEFRIEVDLYASVGIVFQYT
jgi:hypothetical protein